MWQKSFGSGTVYTEIIFNINFEVCFSLSLVIIFSFNETSIQVDIYFSNVEAVAATKSKMNVYPSINKCLHSICHKLLNFW